jgi:hypothetical protein
MVEHPRRRWIPARGDVGASLLVQPPPGQAELGRYGQRLFMHNAVGSNTEHVEVRDHAAPGEPLAAMKAASRAMLIGW